MSGNRFEACLSHVLAAEGGYVDHPADPGGATNMGITRATLAAWRGVVPATALPKSEVRALDRSEAAAIYRARYWDRCACDAMPAGLDLALFDFAVNSGPQRAIRTLQALVGAQGDGIVGPVTLAGISRRSPIALVDALCRERMQFLQRLSSFPTFGRGWTRRVESVRASAGAAARTAQNANKNVNKEHEDMDILAGYKTYAVGAMMLILGVLGLMGVVVPGFAGGAGMELIMEGFAIIFLRKGIKSATFAPQH